VSAAAGAPVEAMNDTTRAALLALNEALAADPEARRALAVYGDLPEHLDDAVEELVDLER
jgi:hypothetical protein